MDLRLPSRLLDRTVSLGRRVPSPVLRDSDLQLTDLLRIPLLRFATTPDAVFLDIAGLGKIVTRSGGNL